MKTGRNDPCPCGSGKKYKHCCYSQDTVKHEEPIIAAPEPEHDEVDAQTADAGPQHEKEHAHQKDRSRFQGEVKGGASGFRPRATRGAQRGS